MKKMTLFICMAVVISITACKKPIKIEECEQLYDKYEVPQLSTDTYNSIYAVTLNFAYAVRENEGIYQELYPNPYSSRIGDTVLLRGFIRHSYGQPFTFKDNQWQCLMVDDSIIACDLNNNVGGGLDVCGDDKSVLQLIDDTRCCYVKGVITYGGLPVPWDCLADPHSCYYLSPVCHVISITN